MEEVDYDPSDEFAQLLDDFEYLYVFNTNTRKSSKLSAYTENNRRENIRPEHITQFYKNEAKPGDLVVSYWGETSNQILVPDS